MNFIQQPVLPVCCSVDIRSVSIVRFCKVLFFTHSFTFSTFKYPSPTIHNSFWEPCFRPAFFEMIIPVNFQNFSNEEYRNLLFPVTAGDNLI